MERRPFLLNDVLIRQNPNAVQYWANRVALYEDNKIKVKFIFFLKKKKKKEKEKRKLINLLIGCRNLYQSINDN